MAVQCEAPAACRACEAPAAAGTAAVTTPLLQRCRDEVRRNAARATRRVHGGRRVAPRGLERHTFAQRVTGHASWPQVFGGEYAYLAHRLDRGTSGCVAVARTPKVRVRCLVLMNSTQVLKGLPCGMLVVSYTTAVVVLWTLRSAL